MDVHVASKEEFLKLPVSKRMQLTKDLGLKASQIINRAVVKANKVLNPFGFKIAVQIDFSLLEEKK